MPRVSIVLPARNQAGYLGASVASVFAQAYADHELIVVDDGSTEDLPAVLAPFRGRLRFERQEPSGVAAATNRGAGLARGELLAFHDADDLMEPERLAAPIAMLDADPTLALVFGNGTRIDAGGAVRGPVIPPRQARRLVRHGVRVADLLRRSLVYLQAAVVRREVFEALGGLRAYRSGADWDFVLRCALRHRIAYVDAPLFRYREHPGTLTADRVRMAGNAVAVLRDLVEHEPLVVEQVGRRAADRALARRLARLAAQEARAGDPAAARTHLAEAVARAPYVLKYRLRLLVLERRAG